MACMDEYIEGFEGCRCRRGVKLFSPDSVERVREEEEAEK